MTEADAEDAATVHNVSSAARGRRVIRIFILEND
jgi:hypothetical protein